MKRGSGRGRGRNTEVIGARARDAEAGSAPDTAARRCDAVDEPTRSSRRPGTGPSSVLGIDDMSTDSAPGRPARSRASHAASSVEGRGTSRTSRDERSINSAAIGNGWLRAPTGSTSCRTSRTNHPAEDRRTKRRCGRCSGARRWTNPAAVSAGPTRARALGSTSRSTSPRPPSTEPRSTSQPTFARSSASNAARRSGSTASTGAEQPVPVAGIAP